MPERIAVGFEELHADATFAVRQMRRAPVLTLTATLTLALGIGANTAIFALVDAVLLRALPLPEPERVVMLWERSEAVPRGRVSPLNMFDWTQRSRTIDAIAGFAPNVGGMVMTGGDGVAETVPRQWVMAGFFDVLGVKPIVGRTFTAADNDTRANAVVLSEGFWRTRFNGDPGVAGRGIRLDGELFTVVGVVPNESQIIARTSIWALMSISLRPEMRSFYPFHAIGRLKPGVTVDAAASDLAAVAEELARELPASNKGRGVVVEALHEAVFGRDLRTTSMLFLGVVGIVLLICCANVANLLLARATARARELAIRSALGAGRRRVVRQLLTESLLLSILGGMLGLGVGALILNVAPALIPPGLLPGTVVLAVDGRIAAFCATSAILVGLLFGLAPACQATASPVAQALATDSRTVTGRGGRLRSLLIVGQVATAVLLLFAAGLLLRTLIAIETVDRGYRAEGVLSMAVDPIASRYPTAAALTQFFASVEREIRALPGVSGVAWASTLPLGPSYFGDALVDIVDDPPFDQRRSPTADYQIVSPSYFDTVDLPIVSGRGFDARDTRDSVQVCLVNEAFVRAHLQGRAPIGVRLALRPGADPKEDPDIREIVGVVRQVKRRPDEIVDLLQVYVPMAQDLRDDAFLLVRTASARAAEALAPSLRKAIGRVDTDQLVSVRNVRTLDDIRREATSRHRFRAVMVITFAALALVLAMVGVVGTLAYSVQQRVRDLAVRRALGATTADVFNLVIRSAIRVIGTGAVLGLLLSVLLGRLLTSVLFGVQPMDAVTFAAVVIVLGLTAVAATIGPARRATRIDPVSALRSE